jgi:hypothetical protein
MYKTYSLINENSELTIGIKDSLIELLIPPIQKSFEIKRINTESIPGNPAADWPLGEK